MPYALHLNVGGVWKKAFAWTKVDGVWKKSTLKQNVADVWKLISVWPTAALESIITGLDYNYTPYSATSELIVGSAGGWSTSGYTYSMSGTWIDQHNSNSDYEVRFTLTSGALTGGSATSTWLSLTSDRSWSVSNSSPGVVTATGTLEIRDKVSQTVLATSTVTITAEIEDAIPP